MSELQQILLTLTSVSQQIITSQILISGILANEAHGLSPETLLLLSQLKTEDMKRLQLLGEAGRLIAHIE